MATEFKVPVQARTPFDPAWESLSDLAKWLGISERCVSRWCVEGVLLPRSGTRWRLDYIWIGGSRKSSREWVLGFLERINSERGVDLSSLLGIGIGDDDD